MVAVGVGVAVVVAFAVGVVVGVAVAVALSGIHPAMGATNYYKARLMGRRSVPADFFPYEGEGPSAEAAYEAATRRVLLLGAGFVSAWRRSAAKPGVRVIGETPVQYGYAPLPGDDD